MFSLIVHHVFDRTLQGGCTVALCMPVAYSVYCIAESKDCDTRGIKAYVHLVCLFVCLHISACM